MLSSCWGDGGPRGTVVALSLLFVGVFLGAAVLIISGYRALEVRATYLNGWRSRLTVVVWNCYECGDSGVSGAAILAVGDIVMGGEYI